VTAGDFELVEILVEWSVTIPAFAAIVVLDERRLSGPQLGRAWPPQTRDAAIFALWLFCHPVSLLFCLLVHFVRTRRNVLGAIWGVLWCLVVYAVETAALLGAAAACGQLEL
jgi:hypothetical protein